MAHYYVDLSTDFIFYEDLYFKDSQAYFLDSLSDEDLKALNIKRVEIKQEETKPLQSENPYLMSKELIEQNLDFDILSMQRMYVLFLEQEAKIYLLSENESLCPTLKAFALSLKKDLQSFANDVIKAAKEFRAYLALYYKELKDLRDELVSLDEKEAEQKYNELNALGLEDEKVKDFLNELNENDFDKESLKNSFFSYLLSLKEELKEELKSELKEEILKPPSKLENESETSQGGESQGGSSESKSGSESVENQAQSGSGSESSQSTSGLVSKIRLSLSRKGVNNTYKALCFQGLALVLDDDSEIFVNSKNDLRYQALDNVSISIKEGLSHHLNADNWYIQNALIDYTKTASKNSFLSKTSDANAVYDFDFSLEKAVLIKGVRVNAHTHMKNRDFSPYIKISLFDENDTLLASQEHSFKTAKEASAKRLGLAVNGEDIGYEKSV